MFHGWSALPGSLCLLLALLNPGCVQRGLILNRSTSRSRHRFACRFQWRDLIFCPRPDDRTGLNLFNGMRDPSSGPTDGKDRCGRIQIRSVRKVLTCRAWPPTVLVLPKEPAATRAVPRRSASIPILREQTGRFNWTYQFALSAFRNFSSITSSVAGLQIKSFIPASIHFSRTSE